jgi:serine/threonine protein kinase
MGKAADPALLGRTIAGKFAIESFIGGGAMGQVYKAHQIALDKTVALKVMHRDLAADDTYARRFHREAQAASRLDHPNSMRVLDFGQDEDGLLYLAMEYLDGRDLLRVILDEWPLSGTRIADVLMQTLAALAMAHDLGIVHRDLKPENIMILRGTDDEGRGTDLVKVCDFGIAKITKRTSKDTDGGAKGALTTQGLVVGTPEYMSPEQGKGEPLDSRSDLYSTGVILFQLLTGRVPFEAESALGVVLKHVTEEPPRPSSINPAIDPRLEAICLRAMKKPRDARYQTARAMRAELRSALEGSGVRGPLPSTADSGTTPVIADAATLQAGVPVFDSAARAELLGPRSSSTGTPSGTTALPSELLPVRPLWRSLAFVGVAALVVGIGAALALGVGKPAPADDGAVPVGAAAITQSPPAVQPEPPVPSVVDTPSASDKDVAVPTPKHLPAAAPKPAAAAPTAPVAASPPTESAPVTFSLQTSSANPQVTKAVGVSAQALRHALPAFQFTQCYRDALKSGGKRLEGQLSLHMTFDTQGHVKTLVSGSAPLPAMVAPCVTDALNTLPVTDLAPAGGSAEVIIAFVPE